MAAPKPAASRKTGLPKPDSRGRCQVSVGPAGSRRKFTFPREVSQVEAARRRDVLRTVHEAFGEWSPLAVEIAESVRQGELIDVSPAAYRAAGNPFGPVPDGAPPDVLSKPREAQVRAAVRSRLARHIPADLLLHEADRPGGDRAGVVRRLKMGVKAGYQSAAKLVELGEQVPPPPNDLAPAAAVVMGAASVVKNPAAPVSVPGTLHEQFNRYLAAVQAEARGASDRHAKVRQLIARHPDTPLAALDLDACRAMIDFWRARPESRRGGRYTVKRARQMVAELMLALNWMHLDGECGWREPADLPRLNRKVDADTPAERAATGTGVVRTFTNDELAKLLRHGDALDQLMLVLGLNLAGGAAEVGRLTWGHLYPPGPHPWAGEGLDVPDSSHGWAGFVRAKSGVAGWWPLWRETAALLNGWRESETVRNGSPPADGSRVLVVDSGPLYRDGGSGRTALKNAQSLVAKRWSAQRTRCEKAGGAVPRLPFGTVRKQFSGWATKAGVPAEVNDTVLCHGSPHPSGPLLFRHYSSRPWSAAFEAVERYGRHLRPALAELDASLPNTCPLREQ
ncbi:hypothetical protein [Alienimonas californiensis]|uniref:Core-binding (CB) domain-containing protein n=1 Tax=Alienimonas californiensis TaxID=2527989 RepID=A0A517PCW0_9PLAN|nr:hypothetical protein [Alienimonas californiensis]QDT17223.1 hypothetical protein CA12_33350 [Alienimonas californiensis]